MGKHSASAYPLTLTPGWKSSRMTIISSKCTREIKRIICPARQKVCSEVKHRRSRHINKSLKVRLINALVWSILLYGVERWTIKRSDKYTESAVWKCDAGFEYLETEVSWRENGTSESVLEEFGLETGKGAMRKVPKLRLHAVFWTW